MNYVRMSKVVMKQIPNVLTFIRFVLVIPFLFCIFHKQFIYAFYIFLIAGVTDALDGWLARGFSWKTDLGSIMDPLADKILISASFLSLAWLQVLPWWLVLLIFARDLTIFLGVVAWYLLIPKKPHLNPTCISKVNTVFQLLLVLLCLYDQAFGLPYLQWITVCMILTTVTTSISFVDYVWHWGNKAWQQRISRV